MPEEYVNKMDPIKIIEKFYHTDSKAYTILLKHSILVARKALEIARRVPELQPDLQFIEEAAMLHDIGIFLTYAPKIGCTGTKEYICHGYLGRELLDGEDLPRHALVCERHTGMGLTLADIEKKNLPLPKRDMIPISIEEKIICFADKFFSKNPNKLEREKTLDKIRKGLSKFGKTHNVSRFNEACRLFGEKGAIRHF